MQNQIDPPGLSRGGIWTGRILYVGILIWAGIYLRDERLRALIPVKRRAPA